MSKKNTDTLWFSQQFVVLFRHIMFRQTLSGIGPLVFSKMSPIRPFQRFHSHSPHATIFYNSPSTRPEYKARKIEDDNLRTIITHFLKRKLLHDSTTEEFEVPTHATQVLTVIHSHYPSISQNGIGRYVTFFCFFRGGEGGGGRNEAFYTHSVSCVVCILINCIFH